jgi:hypothetical protein
MNETYREGLRRFLRARCRKHGISYGTPELRGAASDGTARVGGAWSANEPDDGTDPVHPASAPQGTRQLSLL